MFADTHLVLIKALWLFSLMLLVRQSQLMISSNPAQEEETARSPRRLNLPRRCGAARSLLDQVDFARRMPRSISAGEIWGGGSGVGKGREGAIIRKGARKVRTTEHRAHKFSCASAGTAVPLWTSSVLQ